MCRERDLRWTEPVKSAEYLRKKYIALFDSHDVTGDGKFDERDITAMYEKLRDITKLSSEQLKDFKEQSMQYYKDFILGTWFMSK